MTRKHRLEFVIAPNINAAEFKRVFDAAKALHPNRKLTYVGSDAKNHYFEEQLNPNFPRFSIPR